MWQIDRAKAKAEGYTDQEIDQYLNGLNKQEQPVVQEQPTIQEQPIQPTPPLSPNPVPTPTDGRPTADELLGTPNVVPAFKSPTQTQYIGENPQNYPVTGGHAGIDEYDTNFDQSMTNPVGGRAFTFQQYPGYGEAALIVGGNPEETAAMSPEEIKRIQEEVDLKGPSATSASDFNIPGRDVSIQGHASDLGNVVNGQPIATGEAKMTMGGSGGWAPHGHWEINDRTGKQVDPVDFYKKMTGKQYPVNPSSGEYTEDEIRRILATYR